MTRHGVRNLRPTRPAGLGYHLAEPPCNGPTRDHHLDFALWHTPQKRRQEHFLHLLHSGDTWMVSAREFFSIQSRSLHRSI